MFDYLVVGAGFAGATVAERLAADAGKKVLICDRRPHIGGNAYDHYDESGILVHKYGPHIFHTNSRDVYDYLSRFTDWRPYQHRVLASVDGQLLPIPINLNTVNRMYGTNLTSFQVDSVALLAASSCLFNLDACSRSASSLGLASALAASLAFSILAASWSKSLLISANWPCIFSTNSFFCA